MLRDRARAAPPDLVIAMGWWIRDDRSEVDTDRETGEVIEDDE